MNRQLSTTLLCNTPRPAGHSYKTDHRSSDWLWNTRQDFLMVPTLWAAAMETERRCFSKVILASNVTPSITISADNFSKVPANQWGWLVMNCAWPGDYHSLSLIAFTFIPHRLHRILTMYRLRFRDSWTHRRQSHGGRDCLTEGGHNSYQSSVVNITVSLSSATLPWAGAPSPGYNVTLARWRVCSDNHPPRHTVTD